MACGYSHDIEEVREGEDQTYHKPTNRKRSARNAKCTKPATDGEGCGCKSSKKGKKTCGCDSCSPKMDSLTAGMFRADLKCGKGAISEGEKCTKGSAERVQRTMSNRQARKLEREAQANPKLKLTRQQLAEIGVARGTNTRKALSEYMKPPSATVYGGKVYLRSGFTTKDLKERLEKTKHLTKDPQQVALRQLARRELFNRRAETVGNVAAGAVFLTGAALGLMGERDNRRRSKLERAYRSPSAKRPRRDSVYAPGFTPDLENLSI